MKRWKDTEHQGDQGEQRHPHPHVSHPVLVLRLGQSVGQSRLETHEQHAAGERHARAHVVQHLGKVHLRDTQDTQDRRNCSIIIYYNTYTDLTLKRHFLLITINLFMLIMNWLILALKSKKTFSNPGDKRWKHTGVVLTWQRHSG